MVVLVTGSGEVHSSLSFIIIIVLHRVCEYVVYCEPGHDGKDPGTIFFGRRQGRFAAFRLTESGWHKFS